MHFRTFIQGIVVATGVAGASAMSPLTLASLLARDDSPPYPNKVSQKFQRYVALGDSYSAGPGYGRAGDPISTRPGDTPPYAKNCSQNDGAWPAQLNRTLQPKEFQFSACTGYTSGGIREIEILDPKSNFGNPDLVTLTLGGNNNNAFLNVIIGCPFGIVTLQCDAALSNAQRSIDGIDQELNDTITAAATHNAGANDRRTVIVMGYPQLYNNGTSLSLNCALSSYRRRQINSLVVQLNSKIQNMANALQNQMGANRKIAYADPNVPDDYAEGARPAERSFGGHRFCELWNWAYLNGGAPPENLSLGNLAGPPDITNIVNPLNGLKLIGDALNVGWAYGIGLFHPILKGHEVMTDAALNVLSTLVMNQTIQTPPSTSGAYLIVPRPSANQSARVAFGSTLASQLGGQNKFETINDTTRGPLLWKANLSTSQINDINGKSDIVADIVADTSVSLLDGFVNANGTTTNNAPFIHRHPKQRSLTETGTISHQSNAPPDLAILSQPLSQQGQGFWYSNDYYYDPSAGAGSTVYIIDTGANIKHPELSGIHGIGDFIYTSQSDRQQSDTGYHGTCVASLVGGTTYGSAKNVALKIVKLPSNLFTSDWIDALAQVKQDIQGGDGKPSKRGKAVVNISGGISAHNPSLIIALFRQEIEDILAMDVPIVAAAGNKDSASPATEPFTYPQLFAQDTDGIINVGATSIGGYPLSSSTSGRLVHVWAPGESIQCAASEYDPKSGGPLARAPSGTSFAAPRVAGLAAYIQGLAGDGNTFTASQLQYYIETLSWPRFNSGPDVVSNGYAANCIAKRDGSSTCSLNATAIGLNITQADTNGTNYDIGFGVPAVTNTTNPATSGVACSTNSTSQGGLVFDSLTISTWCDPLRQNPKGCDNSSHGGYFLANNTTCPGNANLTVTLDNHFSANSTDLRAKLSANLNDGSAFAFNVSACIAAVTSIVNGCGSYKPPSGATNETYQWYGSTEINNGTSGIAGLVLNLSPAKGS